MNQAHLLKPSLYTSTLRLLGTNHRGFVGIVIVASVMMTCEPSRASILGGLIISLLGESLRIWTAGYGYRAGAFTLNGPYRFVRHPYFLGSTLLYLGVCLAGRNAWIAGIGLIMLSLGFGSEVQRNEERAAHALGPAFGAYKAKVPAFFPQLLIPKISGMPKGEAGGFSLRNAVLTGRHRELDALLVMLVSFGLLYIANWLDHRDLFHWSMAVATGFFITGRLVFFKFNARSIGDI